MLQGEEKKAGKVKKGWLAVRVGVEGADGGDGGGFRRFVIPIAYLYHPLFRRLLEAARDAYGYDSAGPLRLPCSVDEFLRLRSLVERRPTRPAAAAARRRRTASTPAADRTTTTTTPSPRAPAPKSAPDRSSSLPCAMAESICRRGRPAYVYSSD